MPGARSSNRCWVAADRGLQEETFVRTRRQETDLDITIRLYIGIITLSSYLYGAVLQRSKLYR